MKILFLAFCLLTFLAPAYTQDFEKLREKMVREQLRDINSKPVLNAMRTVERHRFVPASQQVFSYDDTPLPIGEGQTISQPYVVAFMTEVLDLKPSDRVLEIGTGSGYQAAILSGLCEHVYTIEIVTSLGRRADSVLRVIGYANISVRIGDGYLGWPEQAPFDAIIVTCSPSHIPKPLQEQLKEGGRMIIPVGESGVQELVLVTRRNGKLTNQKRLPVRFVSMRNEHGKRY